MNCEVARSCARAYEAGYPVNEAGDGVVAFDQTLTPDMFSPEAATRVGH